jgi:hypothetical protein
VTVVLGFHMLCRALERWELGSCELGAVTDGHGAR